MRLIDADALLKAFYRELDNAILYGRIVKPLQDLINEAPTVDAVPVEVVADMFGEVPCNYAFCARQVDDFMYEQCDGWCEDKCGEVPMIECWKRFFKAWVERKDDE